MTYYVTFFTCHQVVMTFFNFQLPLVAKFGPKMSEIAKFVDNSNKFALPVKALFTSKLGKPVLPVFTNFYRYKFTTLCVR